MTVPQRAAPDENPLPSIDTMIDRFEAAGHDDGHGDKCWHARDLAVLLGYKRWETFPDVLAKAKAAARVSGHDPQNHFRDVTKMVSVGSGAERPIADVALSRYAAYLTAQNADARKHPVAIAQTYFAIQTRRQELTDQNGPDFSTLSDVQQRLYLRNQVMQENKRLATTAKGAGVDGSGFGKFQNRGYQGLYGGRGADDIRDYKALPKQAKILDHMGPTELAANLFRITQTEEKLRSNSIKQAWAACEAHFEVGKKVRQTMRELSGILPEDLPVEEDVKKIASAERRAQRRLPPIPTVAPAVEAHSAPEPTIVAIDLKADLWKYALLIMSVQPGQAITTSDLIAELPKYIRIDDDQAEPNSSRKDSRFSQLVRNLKSHKSSSTNFICRGFAVATPGGFEITDRGLQYVQTYFGDPKPSSIEERYERDQHDWVARSVGLTSGELAELEWDLLPIEGGDTFSGYMVAFAEGSDRNLLNKVRGLGLGYTVQVGFPPDDDDSTII